MSHQILHLFISENQVTWERFTCELDGTNRIKVDGSPKKGFTLGEDALVKRTIALLSDLQQLLGDWRRSGDWDQDRVQLVTERVIETLGEQLYEFLFVQGIHEALHTALGETQGEMLRIVLEIQGDSLAKYGAWPWEYLRCPPRPGVAGSGMFLALQTQLVLNRRLFLEKQQAPVVLKSSKPVVLLVVAGPPGRSLGEFGNVQATTVVTTLRNLRDAGVIELLELVEPEYEESPDYKPTASWAAFKKLAQGGKPDVIHFIGHGRINRDAERSELVFVGDGCTADPRTDVEFVQAVSSNTKLVFLQACESALPGPRGSASSVGQMLANKNIPAVVAMQGKIENIVANTFATGFYAALSDHKPVDWAVRKGREAIESGSPTLRLAFGVPVVYLHSYDALFEPRKSAPADATARTVSALETMRSAAPLQPFEACPRCDEKDIVSFCADCGLRVICTRCGRPLARDAKAPKDTPMKRFCKNCGQDNPQQIWKRDAGQSIGPGRKRGG